MRLLHPVMPHITEEIWQLLSHSGESVMMSPWPEAPTSRADADAERALERLLAVIRAIRSLRVDLGLSAGTAVTPVLRPADERSGAELEGLSPYVIALTRAGGVSFQAPGAPPPSRAAAAAADGVEVFLPVGDADVDAIRRRLTQELSRLHTELARVEGRLGSVDFQARAPADVVDSERRRAEDLRKRGDVVSGHLRALG